MLNILLIEDEYGVSSFIKRGLEENHYHVTLAYEGRMGLNMALERDFDIILLDVILPQINGYEICAELKKYKQEIPILMLSALSTIKDKITGFDHGVDDYLTKPFHFDELLARINVLTRRRNQNAIPELVYKAGDLSMDAYRKTVKRSDQEIVLTVKEYTLLEYLLVNKNKVISRTKIAEAVWGIGFNRGTNLIDVYINYLRSKIDKGFSIPLIHTVIGMGYILKDE